MTLSLFDIEDRFKITARKQDRELSARGRATAALPLRGTPP